MEVYHNTYTLKNCKYIVNPDGEIRKNLNIVIQNGEIKHIGKEVEGEEIDCSKFVAIPGLVNAHTHSPMVVLRGYYDDAELKEWLNKIWDYEKNSLTKEQMRIGSEIAILEMLLNGTTAFVDMYFNPEQVAELSEKYKIRAYGGYTFLDQLFDPYEIDKKQRGLKKSNYFTPIVNMHSVYATSERTLVLAKQLADEIDTWIHVHMSETREELFTIKKKTGLFPVQYLAHLGMLNKRLQLVHLGWVASWEIEMIQKSGSTVTYCPSSNMKLATGGSFPLKEMSRKGINITLGTDGPASNNTLDLFKEMKVGVLLQRQMYWNVDVKAIDLLQSATINGYKLIGVKGGVIREGYKADIVLLDANLIYPLADYRMYSHLVYFVDGRYVEKVIVDGVIHNKRDIEEQLIERVKDLERLIT
ncbi:amidohydrolase [Stygiolobus caldivivus]|uniref:N-ethylammeline chlorohydrolase n=1 Tax=Stygiolobus caldivivus TaxID=2824673 RepID=A0A8D5U4C2_9CREN|nr:amidohydrolase [Stygiolobus caldivivus]BCU69176.1 N-ethylammeline chlorohydrolase [Stygiolobus caldivivus]